MRICLITLMIDTYLQGAGNVTGKPRNGVFRSSRYGLKKYHRKILNFRKVIRRYTFWENDYPLKEGGHLYNEHPVTCSVLSQDHTVFFKILMKLRKFQYPSGHWYEHFFYDQKKFSKKNITSCRKIILDSPTYPCFWITPRELGERSWGKNIFPPQCVSSVS